MKQPQCHIGKIGPGPRRKGHHGHLGQLLHGRHLLRQGMSGRQGGNQGFIEQHFLLHVRILDADAAKPDIDLAALERVDLLLGLQLVQYDFQVLVAAQTTHHQG